MLADYSVSGTRMLSNEGIFLMRKSSEGLGLPDQELAKLSNSANRKRFPSLPARARALKVYDAEAPSKAFTNASRLCINSRLS